MINILLRFRQSDSAFARKGWHPVGDAGWRLTATCGSGNAQGSADGNLLAGEFLGAPFLGALVSFACSM
jgi:hypothetical protein